MNYYEHHIGDYDKNTSHLTACEDGIYSRLLRRYYDKECPLPADVDKVKRLARARVPDEMAAVDAILDEFFVLEADGWHHKVCDAVISAFKAGEPEREAKKRNEDTRLERHRAERAALFATINAAGQHLPWNTKMDVLRAAADKVGRVAGQPATPETPETPTATQPATAPATPATATQTPVPIPQTPDTRVLSSSGAGVPAAPSPAPTPKPTKAPKPPAAAPDEDSPTSAVWRAYATTYAEEHQVEPVRNAQVNGQLAQLVGFLGRDEAVQVVAFYVRSRTLDPYYRRNGHPIGTLVKQWTQVRMAWAREQSGLLPSPPLVVNGNKNAAAAAAIFGSGQPSRNEVIDV